MKRFFDVFLRTLRVDVATDFYRSVLGAPPRNVFPLHERALARGARPHWLGFVDVGDVDGAVARFVERGAEAMGPKWVNPDGIEAAYVRDPGGAMMALAKPSSKERSASEPLVPDVIFHSLNTPDVERAMTNYREMFGWDFRAPLDLGARGTFHPFGWEVGGEEVGVLSDIANRPGVHPHWLFHFRIFGLDAAIARVRSEGGLALEPIDLPNGDRIAVCDDNQGAAFALHEPAKRAP
jgi:predicted enzyme related to lactoylglutathione lyase